MYFFCVGKATPASMGFYGGSNFRYYGIRAFTAQKGTVCTDIDILLTGLTVSCGHWSYLVLILFASEHEFALITLLI